MVKIPIWLLFTLLTFSSFCCSCKLFQLYRLMQRVLARFRWFYLVLDGFSSFQVVLARFSSFLTLVSTFRVSTFSKSDFLTYQSKTFKIWRLLFFFCSRRVQSKQGDKKNGTRAIFSTGSIWICINRCGFGPNLVKTADFEERLSWCIATRNRQSGNTGRDNRNLYVMLKFIVRPKTPKMTSKKALLSLKGIR